MQGDTSHSVVRGPHNGAGRITPALPAWLREMYPLQTRSLEVGGQRMSFVEEGLPGGPTIVLLHGNPTWSFLYRNIIPRLSGRYRVIAPDHVGFGLSDKPSDPAYYTLERHIANFTELMHALQLKNVTLVLHDWGGPIGLGYAVTEPQNIARLMLMNTWAFVPQSPKFRLPLGLRLARRRGLGDLLVSRLNLFVTRGLRLGTHRPIPGAVMKAYKFPFPTAASRAGVLAFPRMVPLREADPAYTRMVEIQAGLKNITAPVDILWGLRDPVFSRLPAYLLRDAFKNSSEPVFLPDASHFLQEDRPDAVAAKILEEKKAAATLKILS